MFPYFKKAVARRRIFFFLLLTFMGGYTHTLSAQQGREDVLFRVTDSVIDVSNEQLADITYEVENKGGNSFSGGLHFYVPKEVRIVNKDHLSLYLEAGAKKYVVVKVYIKGNAPAGLIKCYAQLSNNSNTLLKDGVAILRIAGKKDVRSVLTQPDMVLPERGAEISIPVRVSNKGNTTQKVSIVAAFPGELHDKINSSISLSLPEFSDTVIFFTRKVNAALKQMEEVKVGISGIYENGDFFSSHTLILQDPKNRRRFGASNALSYKSGLPNSVSLGVQNLGTNGEAYFVRSNGDYQLGGGNLSYNVNALKWKAEGIPTQVNNTWVNYERKGLGLHLGNITSIGEINLNGRGAELYYNDTVLKKGIAVGFIDKSFNLISVGNNYSLGQAAWLSLRHTGRKVFASTQLIYDTDNYFKTKSLTWLNEGTWNIKDGLQLKAKAGLASTQTETEGNIGSSLIGAGINGFITERISVLSDNFYSSGYFPGTRRGVTTFNERISYHFKRSSIAATYSNYEYNPRYSISGFNSIYGTYTHIQNAELVFMQYVSPVFSYSIAPVGYKERGTWRSVAGIRDLTLEAARLNGQVSFTSLALRQSVSLRLEGGQYRTSLMPDGTWQYRTTFNWNYSIFRLSATAQRGLFLLAESFREDIAPGKFYRYSLSPMLSKTFLQKKLLVEAGVNYYKDNVLANTTYTAYLQYDFRHLRLFGNFQYSNFNNLSSYTNIMLGLTRTLPQSNPAGKEYNNSLSVFVYKDYNSNGIYDAGDSVSADNWVYINRTLFGTDSKGRLVYRKLPDGMYNVNLPTRSGWYAADQEILLDKKSKKDIEIALQQTGTLAGRISFEESEDSELTFSIHKNKAIQTIVATASDGKSVITKTNDDGQYILYLPAGQYHIAIIDLPAQVESTNNNQEVTITSGKTVSDINFNLRVKQRKVEVKKFGGK